MESISAQIALAEVGLYVLVILGHRSEVSGEEIR